MQDDQLQSLEFSAPSRIFGGYATRFPGDGMPVGFGQAIKRGLKGSGFYGRASRSEFWYFWLFALVLNIASAIVLDGMLDLGHVDRGVTALISVLVIVVQVRRLHDVGRSGWWVLLAFTIVGIIPLFVWSVRKGDPGPNRFDLRGKKRDAEHQKNLGPTAAIDQVERLHKLHQTGAITEEEFQALKRRAL